MAPLTRALPQKSKYPTPFEIFHFDTSQALTPSQVKGRYYDLCRLYHPDTKQSTSSDTSLEFKQIVAAYEVLRSPSKRSIYLRSGYGWTSNSPRPPGTRTNDGYDFSRGPSMRYGGPGAGRGAYPSQAYDSAYWTDPYNPHFRPDASGGGPGTDMGGQATPGWGNKGFLGTNGTVFLALLSLTLIITPLSFYNLVPPSALLPADSPYSDPSWGGLSNGRDKRHDAAARALTEARQAAKDGGMAKREAMGFVSFPCLPS